MDRRLVSGAVAGLAAIVLATGGGTFAAFDDVADVPQSDVAAGVLQLDVTGSAGAAARISFHDLEPGDSATNRIWVAANDPASNVPGRLAVTVRDLVDTPGPCATSTGKAEGETASGITGCTIAGDGRVSGTPSVGVASRVLDVTANYVPTASSPDSCAGQHFGTASLLPTSGPGDLYEAAHANRNAGTTALISDSAGHPITLAPGRGICFAVSAKWPPDVTDVAHASPEHPVDNAAQGDSFTVALQFALTQVTS